MLQTIFNIRYTITSLKERVEGAILTDCEAIVNEDAGTPDHANRYAWAEWASLNSSVATTYFMGPLALNSSIQASVEADPTGGGVTDNDISFVVASELERVITTCVRNPPAGFVPPSA
jgi:hypothetical protein